MPLRTSLLDALLTPKAATIAAFGAASLCAGAATFAIWPTGEMPPTEVAVVEEGTPAFTPVAIAPAAPRAEPDEQVDRNSILGDPVRLTRALQTELARIGCYDGKINGRWNTKTRIAMARLIEESNARLPADMPDPVLLALAEGKPEGACDGPMTVAVPAAPMLDATAQTSAAEPYRTPASEAIVAPVPRTVAPQLPPEDAQIETASIEPAQNQIASAAALAAIPAAATAAAVPYPAPSAKKPRGERRAAVQKRKKRYKQPSLARTFKSIQRSMNKLF